MNHLYIHNSVLDIIVPVVTMLNVIRVEAACSTCSDRDTSGASLEENMSVTLGSGQQLTQPINYSAFCETEFRHGRAELEGWAETIPRAPPASSCSGRWNS